MGIEDTIEKQHKMIQLLCAKLGHDWGEWGTGWDKDRRDCRLCEDSEWDHYGEKRREELGAS
jgi:hypothetical protein